MRVFLIVSFLSVASLASPKCEYLLGGVPVSKGAFNAVIKAREHFDIEVLSTMIDGQKHSVIIAGETHIKPQAAADAGRELIRHFDFKGVEGVFPNHLAAKILFPIMDVIQNLQMRIGNLRQSTIYDAIHFDKEASKSKVKKKKARTRSSRSIYNASMSINTNDRDWALPPVILQLELGHEPSLREKLAMLKMPAGLAINFVGLFVNLNYDSFSTGFHQVMTTLLLANIGYIVAERGLETYSSQAWYNTIFPVIKSLVDGRNGTMASNISKGMQTYSQYDHLLVLVGRSHVPGLKNLLIEEYGFTPEPLEIPEQVE